MNETMSQTLNFADVIFVPRYLARRKYCQGRHRRLGDTPFGRRVLAYGPKTKLSFNLFE